MSLKSYIPDRWRICAGGVAMLVGLAVVIVVVAEW